MSEATDWVEQARRLVAGLGLQGLDLQGLGLQGRGLQGPGLQGRPDGDGHVPGGDCRWCPVCQVAAVVRRPEVSEALADALTSAATALRAMAAAAAAAEEERRTAPEQPEQPASAPPPPAPPVQHIEIA
ncbi:hypothetical protein [Geodermatophilus nigrescens]|uniref:Uncharacterized protein n=1 Tax=Geodermatophilus nigrescens TaxID=1070870 RepID=A0A1M5R0I0_9ACTN|nr:hypothetical protein [Geodermatophilus nigrescens]SHH19479.1 hypothetical protein SAMN05444351_4250 [Geodermatophilus nigrescens]